MRSYLSLSEIAFLSGASRRVVKRLISLELIEPVRSQPELCFRPEQARHLRRLLRLHRQLGVSWSSMGLVLELLERIEKLEAQLLE